MKRNITYIFKTEKKLSELKIIYKFRLLTILFTRDFTEIIEKKNNAISLWHNQGCIYNWKNLRSLYRCITPIQTSCVPFSPFSLNVNNITANLFAVYSTLRLKWINFHNLNSKTVIWKRENEKERENGIKSWIFLI